MLKFHSVFALQADADLDLRGVLVHKQIVQGLTFAPTPVIVHEVIHSNINWPQNAPNGDPIERH